MFLKLGKLKMRFAGIDEQNHGKFPEIFACVVSNDPEDVVSGAFKKIRFKIDRTVGTIMPELGDFLGDREYRHTKVTEDDAGVFSGNGLRIINYSELLKQFDGVEVVLVDGRLNSVVIEGVLKHIFPLKPKIKGVDKISSVKHRYQAVNLADGVANFLYRGCYDPVYDDIEAGLKRPIRVRDVLETRVTPKLEEYQHLLPEFQSRARG